MSDEGRSSDSPFVPDYADDDADEPLPEPAALRFRGFRVAFGRAVAGGGGLEAALGKYARDATGGAAIGPRRFGPAYRAGGALFALLGDLRAGGSGEAIAGTDLSGLIGRPAGEACEAVALALAPRNGDADPIRISVQEALGEALAGAPAFDPGAFDPGAFDPGAFDPAAFDPAAFDPAAFDPAAFDPAAFDPAALTAAGLVAVQVGFFAGVLFLDIAGDAGKAWNRAPDVRSTIDAEDRLREIVGRSVDNRLSPLLHGRIHRATRTEIEAFGRRAIELVWSDWEKYR